MPSLQRSGAGDTSTTFGAGEKGHAVRRRSRSSSIPVSYTHLYDECGVRLALEVHPTEIAFDYYSTKRLLDTLDWRPTLGLNFDPSHLQWQGMDPCLFLRDFASRIYHVHMKDVKVKLDGRSGILGSHIEFGDRSRGWNFVSLGHGDVDFDGIIRELNQMGYDGPLSVESVSYTHLVADSCMVLYKGRVNAVMSREEMTEKNVMYYSTGANVEGAKNA